jgi:uncharacterized protein YdaU (DUF1376 family)
MDATDLPDNVVTIGRHTELQPQMALMPWYPRDFASATRGWPLGARGAYRELLDAQWDLGSLPADAQRLRSMAGATPAEWKVAWPLVKLKFPEGPDGLRRNQRLEHHRRKAVIRLANFRAGANLTNGKRWGKP